MKTVLVTGANGFIGAHLCRALAARDYRVRALVRRTSDLQALNGAAVELVYGDVTGADTLLPALRGATTVFHLAGVTRAVTREEYDRVNVTGTRNLVRAAAAEGLERFVLVSSLAAAGPASEGAPRTETDDPRPVGMYGQSKREGEIVCLNEAPGSMRVTIIRPAIVYGPYDDDLLVLYRTARRGLAPTVPGDICASMIHVTDLVDLIERAGRFPVAAGRVYFAADPEPYWMRDIVRLMGRAVKRRVRFFPVIPVCLYPLALINELLLRVGGGLPVLTRSRLHDYRHRFWTADPSAAIRDLDWKPAIDIAQGIRTTTAWYREHGWL